MAFILIGMSVGRLVGFFMGRHYGTPIRFGWLSALGYGVITGLPGGYWLKHFIAPGHIDSIPWLYCAPVFVVSFCAHLAIDRPSSRVAWFGIAWLLFVIAFTATIWMTSILRGF